MPDLWNPPPPFPKECVQTPALLDKHDMFPAMLDAAFNSDSLEGQAGGRGASRN